MSGIQLMFVGSGGGRQVINLSIASPAYNYDVYTNRGPTYVAGNSDITVTISPGVTVGSTSTGSYAFLVPSAFNPGDTVTVVNNGVIQGRGGDGGAGGTIPTPAPSQPFPGNSGGAAVYINRPTTITNNGTLAGGGGGGGGGGAVQPQFPDPGFKFSGGGGGGGAGFDGGTGGIGRSNPGISPPGPSQPGSPGTSAAGGAGGAAGWPGAGNGGTGGGRGASGTSGQSGTYSGGSGGSAGAYIVGQPFVTYPATGTRQGPSS